MKKILTLFIIISFALFGLTACDNSTNDGGNSDGNIQTGATENGNGNGNNGSGDETDNPPETQNSDVLIAYFSCTNTTKSVAETIYGQIEGADIYRITPAVPYTTEDLNYSNSSCRANREQNDPTARPEITGSVQNIKQYDVIFIGYPIWWGQAPKIIYTFFESYDYDFSGVTIIPFCTSGSSGIGTSATNLHSLAPNANWKSGARISGNNVSALIAQMKVN